MPTYDHRCEACGKQSRLCLTLTGRGNGNVKRVALPVGDQYGVYWH